jgi:seryl-tRNA(Sec) selenium transferase
MTMRWEIAASGLLRTIGQYEQSFNERTAMAHFFNAGAGKISQEDWVRVAHLHGVPCFNDAAADVRPKYLFLKLRIMFPTC